MTNQGFLIDSIQIPTKQWSCGNLSKEIIKLISCSEISKIIEVLSNFKYFINWQNMLFDKSTGTVEHCDNWYLDTKPRGLMIASWIALENIHEDAGRFFIVPKSNHLDIPQNTNNTISDNSEYAKYIINYMKDKGLKRFAPN